MSYTYLACPYWHKDPTIRQNRVLIATKIAGVIMQSRQEIIYSPITHGHHIEALAHQEESFWLQHSIEMLKRAKKMTVLMLPLYQESKGIMKEKGVAELLQIPINHIHPGDWEPLHKYILS